jgi:hypothetical protein
MIMSFLRSTMKKNPFHVADVAAEIATVGKRGGGLRRLVPIAPHHVRALDPQLAHLAGREHALRIVERDHLDHDSRQRQADRSRFRPSVERRRGCSRRRLGHPPAVGQRPPEHALAALRHRDRQRRAAAGAMAQRAEIARPKVGMIEQRNPHGRNAEKRGGTFDLNVVQHCLDVEA